MRSEAAGNTDLLHDSTRLQEYATETDIEDIEPAAVNRHISGGIFGAERLPQS